MGRLILIRHGETDWNVARRTQGQYDQPLNARGVEQARLAGVRVREAFAVERAWSSDLRRCLKTADALALDVPVEPTSSLRELDFGEWEGRTWPEMEKEYPALIRRLQRGDPTFRAPGGESLAELAARGNDFIEDSGVLNAEGDVAIVGHGGHFRSLYMTMLELPVSSYRGIRFSNCGITVLESSANGVRLRSFDDTSHLDGLANNR